MHFTRLSSKYVWIINITMACLVVMFFYSCNSNDAGKTAGSIPADSSRGAGDDSIDMNLPENALVGLVVAEGFNIKTMATEPMLKNPTNIDVDEKGRVWVTEAYNYRPGINGNPTNPEGDRIMILEDKNGDGVMDDSKIFYQGPELNAPLGICVLGKRVLISQSPYIWSFYDDNGDDKADRKEILFQGIGGEQHDHGVHAFTFGPDGKLYFNFGNEGQTLKDKNGKAVTDQDGDVIGLPKYREGMVFRCNPDGSNVECLGQNFRNNYEVAVDSYGTMWQSDNDDDGNRSTRINYVMDYGNYGYKDELTGAGWQANRTNMEDSIPFKHWHLNDPGVVPNLLQTGAGSPTGMVVYEGSLLPAAFQNQMIHCDPGPNIIRSYPVKKSGAGYTAEIANIINGDKHKWFRPADICVAPDGSLIVADWYDPGVGGHQAGDQQLGRIYRIAPDVTKYQIPAQDYSTPAGAVRALQSPNLAVRHHAWLTLQEMGETAKPALEGLWRSAGEPRMRARAFWALVKMPEGQKYIAEALGNVNPDFRIMGLRAARQAGQGSIEGVRQLVNDKDPQVRRECAIGLRHNRAADAAVLWTTLAMQYESKDRWYLEALGIAADRQWDKFFGAYLQQQADPLSNAEGRDIVWRARTEKAIPFLARLSADKSQPLQSRLRYFREFDFIKSPSKSGYLLRMMQDSTNGLEFNKLVLHHLDRQAIKQSKLASKTLNKVVEALDGTPEYIELVSQYRLTSQQPRLLRLVVEKAGEPISRDAAGVLLQLGGTNLLSEALAGKDSSTAETVAKALSRVGTKESIDLLQRVALTKSYPMQRRAVAAQMMGGSQSGEDRVLILLKNKKLPKELLSPAVEGLRHAWRKSVYEEGMTYLPKGEAKAETRAISMAELNTLKGVAANGHKVFTNICSVCHLVNKEGYDFGPNLSEIGTKLGKDALLSSIINPSAGISFGFESWELKMKDGSTFTGVVSSKTETDIDLKQPGGILKKIRTNDVKSMKQLPGSLMPEGLHKGISTQDMANLVEYLASLKKKQ